MKAKSLTFRCSPAQLKRLQTAMAYLPFESKTKLLAAALNEFLNFVNSAEMSQLNLFDLVAEIDKTGTGAAFWEEISN